MKATKAMTAPIDSTATSESVPGAALQSGRQPDGSFVLDRGQTVPLYSTVCSRCIHLTEGSPQPKCAAFPDGIPAEIWAGQNDHRAPYPGDHGLRFELVTASEESNRSSTK